MQSRLVDRINFYKKLSKEAQISLMSLEQSPTPPRYKKITRVLRAFYSYSNWTAKKERKTIIILQNIKGDYFSA